MNETALDFEQLVQRLRQGDEAASQLIVQRFERQIQAPHTSSHQQSSASQI